MRRPPLLILTGPVHGGKTSFLKGFLEGQKKAELLFHGILSLAHFEGHRRLGYDGLDIQSGERFPFLRKFPEPGWTQVGPYGVVPEGLARARAAIRNVRDSDLCVIDEMGPLELDGGGFWPCFLELQENRKPLLTVVRQELVKPFSLACGGEPLIFRLAEPDLDRRLRQAIATILR